MANTEPTDAQKAAGNYAKDHKAHHGMRISIENPSGSTRRGKDKDGTPWESEMAHDYGYIRGTKGKDKDHLDVFLGPDHDKPDAKVHVIDQDNADGNFDEHKVMLGFPSENDAYTAYHANYPAGHNGFAGMTSMSVPEFKMWAFAGKGAKTKRTSDMQMFKKGGVVKYFDDGGSAGGDAGGDAGSAGDAGDAGAAGAPGGVGGEGPGPAGDGSAGAAPGGTGDAGGSGAAASSSGNGAAPAADAPGMAPSDEGDTSISDIGSTPTGIASTNSNGIAGMMGVDNPTLASVINGVIGMAANAVAPGIGGIAVGVANSAINGTPASAASSIGSAVASGMGIPGVVGSIAGNAIGNMSGVPSASVPGDPTGGGSQGNGALSQYYGQRQQSAAAPQSAPMTTNGYLPGNVQRPASLYAGGGKVQGALGCACGGHSQEYAGGGTVKNLAEDLGKWLSKAGVMDSAIGGVKPTAANATNMPGWLADFTKSRGIDPKDAEILVSGARAPVDPTGRHSVWAYGAPESDHAWGYANGEFANGSSPSQKRTPALRLYVADPKMAKEIVDPALARHAVEDPWYLQGKLPDVPRHILRDVSDVDGRASVLRKIPSGDEYPLVGQTQHWVPSLADAILKGGISPVGYADGGEVQISRIPRDTSRDTSSQVNFDDLSKAADMLTALRPMTSARPSMRRPEARNDREGAKEFPLQAARGALAGTLGFGGDIEGLGRLLMKKLGVDQTPALPTSDFYKHVLPLAPTSAAGKAGSEIGSAFGVPVSTAVMPLARVAGRAAQPAVQGALSAIEGVAKRAEPGIESWVNNVMSNDGKGAQLLQDLTGGTKSQAVKPKGGNWAPVQVGPEVTDTVGKYTNWLNRDTEMPAVKDWIQKRVGNYMRNDMGTATDPLLKLESEGRLHLTPEDLRDRSQQHGNMKEIQDDTPLANMSGIDPAQVPAGSSFPNNVDFHKAATGRDYATPWESLADSAIKHPEDYGTVGEHILRMAKSPDAEANKLVLPWMEKVPSETPLYKTQGYDQLDALGFGHLRDYLDQATNAGDYMKAYGNPEAFRGIGGPGGPHEGIADMAARGLHIDPADLGKMSLPDVINKASDWNKMLYKAKELANMNKGVKEVVKAYPETGHQWVELAPEGLKAEGDTMRHCVGGYCADVEGGNTRVMSLRDASGKPAVTVELAKPRGSSLDWARQNAPQMLEGLPAKPNRDDYLRLESAVEQSPEYLNHLESTPWQINQIKGPANRAPSKDVLPMVQDLVKNMGPWGDNIGDFGNTGLARFREPHKIFGDTGTQLGELPAGMYTPEEAAKIIGGFNPDAPEGWAATYARNISNNRFAKGGGVGTETVGLGRFAEGDGGKMDQSLTFKSPYGSGAVLPQMPMGFPMIGPTDLGDIGFTTNPEPGGGIGTGGAY